MWLGPHLARVLRLDDLQAQGLVVSAVHAAGDLPPPALVLATPHPRGQARGDDLLGLLVHRDLRLGARRVRVAFTFTFILVARLGQRPP